MSLEGMSQFGLLELSESQGLNVDSGDEDIEVTPANLQSVDRQKTANQSKSPAYILALLYLHFLLASLTTSTFVFF